VTDTAQHLLAAGIAVTGASCTALATAVQQRVARRAPRRRGLNLALVRELAQSRSWLLSWVGLVIGYSCYLVALSMAPLTLVQPILVVGLALGSLFAARLARRPLDPRLMAGSVLCLASLSALLLAARPGSGRYFPVPPGAPLGVGAVVGAVLLMAVLIGRRWPAWGFAAATGALWGTTAALTKLVLAQLAHGWTEPLVHWPLYGVLVSAPLGFVLSQRAFQLSALLAPVNAVISVLDPVVATSIGVLVLGERTAAGAGWLALQIAAAAGVLAGVWLVARRSTQLARAAERQDGRAAEAVAWG
jgi:drug/metabolite transporter (DMT)-like permease